MRGDGYRDQNDVIEDYLSSVADMISPHVCFLEYELVCVGGIE